MSKDYRSASEKFVTEFLDYVEKYDIFDEFDKRTQKMARSAGVDALIKKASGVFPPRVKVGQIENALVKDMDVTIEGAKNILDKRDVFARKIRDNGAARGLLEKVMTGDEKAIALAYEFLRAEKGEKEFDVPTKK